MNFPDEARLWAVDLAVLAAHHERQADPVELDPAELARAATFSDDSNRHDFIAGRVAQRLMAAEVLGVAPEELTAHFWCPDCGPDPFPSHGRPGYLLRGEPAALSVSLSRSHGWALVAMVPAAGVALGVDVQHVAEVAFDGFDDVVLSPAERSRLAVVAPGAQAVWRAAVWARKEALAKYSGLGLRTDPRTISAFPGHDARVSVWDIAPAAVGLPARFVAAVAMSSHGPQ